MNYEKKIIGPSKYLTEKGLSKAVVYTPSDHAADLFKLKYSPEQLIPQIARQFYLEIVTKSSKEEVLSIFVYADPRITNLGEQETLEIFSQAKNAAQKLLEQEQNPNSFWRAIMLPMSFTGVLAYLGYNYSGVMGAAELGSVGLLSGYLVDKLLKPSISPKTEKQLNTLNNMRIISQEEWEELIQSVQPIQE